MFVRNAILKLMLLLKEHTIHNIIDRVLFIYGLELLYLKIIKYN